MALENVTIQETLTEKFQDCVFNFKQEDLFTFEASASIIKELISFLKDNEILRFNFLTDICGVHYPANESGKDFAVVYHLHNWIDNTRIRIKTYLSKDNPEIESLTDVFSTANWMERETYDFFGIKFAGHPNLKKILNDEHMTSFPMRKEYPMEDSQRTDKDDRFFGRETNNNQFNAK